MGTRVVDLQRDNIFCLVLTSSKGPFEGFKPGFRIKLKIILRLIRAGLCSNCDG